MTYSQVKGAIKKKRATVGVIGLGYVGIPTILAMTKAGIKVIGVDINKERVKSLAAGKSFIVEIPDSDIKAALKKFTPTINWPELKKAGVILITVPTPLTKNKTPDTTAIEAAGKRIAQNLKKDTLVILESTTYPGTTEELLKPILEKSGLVAGKDFYLAFAPERIDPGNKKFLFADITKVVGGINQKSTDLAHLFYSTFLKNVHKVSSPRAAEMTKLLENIFRLVNISLVNELKLLSDQMGIDFWEVIEAAKTKPFGFMAFYPGPGVGGHCIPLDPFYLSWKARSLNFFTRFIDLAGEINELMPHTVVTRIIYGLNKHKKSVRGSKILVLGVAYKKDVDDPRESPAIEIIWDLLRKGGEVIYNDPYIPELKVNDHILKSVPLSNKLVKDADCVVVIAGHSAYDYANVAKTAKLVVDTRNAVKERRPNVIK